MFVFLKTYFRAMFLFIPPENIKRSKDFLFSRGQKGNITLIWIKAKINS